MSRQQSLNGFFFNVEKWFGSVAATRMSFAEKGVYLVMMFKQWARRERNLPDNPEQVADLIAVTDSQVQEVLAAWPIVRRKFTTSKHSTDSIFNVEVENTRRQQRANFRKKSEQARVAGKASAAKRKEKKELGVNARSTPVNGRQQIRVDKNKNREEKDFDLIREDQIRENHISPTPVGAAFAHYHEKFLGRYHSKPEYAGGKDAGRWKALVDKHGLEEVRRRIDMYFDSADPFLQRSGHTLNLFFDASTQTKLIAELSGRASLMSETTRHNRAASDQAEQLIIDSEARRGTH